MPAGKKKEAAASYCTFVPQFGQNLLEASSFVPHCEQNLA
jgi:hypothetical protein